MGNYASCCRISQEQGDERPPPWLVEGQKAPLISDAMNEDYKKAVSPTREHAIEKFFHDALLQGKPDEDERELPYLHVADEGEEEAVSDDRSRDETFDKFLDSILDRCFLICREDEWLRWKASGKVGRRSSLLVPPSRLVALLRLPDLDRSRNETAVVLDLDLQPDMFTISDRNVLLVAPLSLHLVRVVYKLNDVADMLQGERRVRRLTREPLASSASTHRGEEDTVEEERPARQELELVMNEYSWILDDFERKRFGRSGGMERKRFDPQSLSRPVRDFSASR
ncbi:hypothetical protein GUITHDRAFT_118787 [Guillardia theta CCMP2712]|uniref:Uncharacterized protein n=2 Tax=Guillardia theta TaxID=55529 RepID=L1IFM3_GUITC|nr:hypothetical protein GUITHDRAFT_118787 [Guillardia theta CCMP2712]EKX35038.1 hypothetical protein GUITHDRAFT_118787 [Guillardia theta CCMP2712]|eukprot:XP_005822018.1 hypothetical protein GUITHDRAFT_118787 [Guillardia theta CCMP2712]